MKTCWVAKRPGSTLIANGDKVGLRDCKVTELYADVKAFFIVSKTVRSLNSMQTSRHSSSPPAHTSAEAASFSVWSSDSCRDYRHCATAGQRIFISSLLHEKVPTPATVGCLRRRPSARICYFPGHWHHSLQEGASGWNPESHWWDEWWKWHMSVQDPP